MKTNSLPFPPAPVRLTVLAAAAALLLATAVAAERPVFRFGAQAHFGQGWSVGVLPRLSGGGLADVRDELYWQIVEPTPGGFSFPANYDNYMTALRNAGIEPLITLSFENTGYDGGQTPYTPSGFSGYARYASEVLKRYGDQVAAVEVWNEYNGTFNKGPATGDRSGNYFKLLQTAYPAIKSVRKDVTVVGGATAGVPLPYFEKLFAAGALNYLDVVSVHPYRTSSTPEGLEVQIAALQALMAKYGPVKPIWVTEIGWPLHASQASGDLNIDETVQAQFLVRACALLASAGVPRVYWYAARDETAHPGMGLVQNNTAFTARKALAALKVLNSQLRYARFEHRENTPPGVYSLKFSTPDGRALRVLWSLSPVTIPVPGTATITGMLGGPPVMTNSLTLGASPVYVSGPLPGLPGAETVRAAAMSLALADSAAGFSLQQGAFGWEYGYFVGDNPAFSQLAVKRVTDWKEEWGDRFVAISITNVDQHPSKSGTQPVSAVRRWTSNVEGKVRINARFKSGLKGDGVRVRVLADGQTIQSAALTTGTSIAADFAFDRPVHRGSTLDFAVDPGPGANIDFDVTQVTVTIERAD
jgi:hypothetical protein